MGCCSSKPEHKISASKKENNAHLTDASRRELAEGISGELKQELDREPNNEAEIDISISTENDLKRLEELEGLAQNSVDQGNWNSAEKYYLESSKLQERNYGKNSADLALTYRNLGLVYQNLKKSDLAEKYYLKWLEIQQFSYDEDLIRNTFLKRFKLTIDRFTKNLKLRAKKLVSKATNESIESEGIPNMPNDILAQIDAYCNEDHEGWQEFAETTKEGIISMLEKKFYNYYLEELLLRRNLDVSLKIRDFLKAKKSFNIFEFEEIMKIKNLKEMSEDQILQELDIDIPNIAKLIPFIKDQLLFKGSFEFEKFSKVVIKNKTTDFKEFEADNESLKDSIENAFGVIQLSSGASPKIYKPVTKFLIEKAFGLNINQSDITETKWKDINFDKRVEIYIACFLLLSEDVYLLRSIDTTQLSGSLNNGYSPIAREILQNISTKFPLFEINKPTSKKTIKNSKMFLSLIDEEVSSVLQRKNSETIHLEDPPDPKNAKKLPKTSKSLCSLLNLNNVNSKHVIVCVSGYLSESDDQVESWEQIIQLFPFTSIYCFLWKASGYLEFAKNYFGTLKKDPTRDFKESTERAIISGGYLAELIKKNFLDKGYCVTIFGFSLGTLVITSCMTELSKFSTFLLDEVMYFGSATSREQASGMEDYKKKLVFGDLSNVFSKNDSILRFVYPIASKSVACGYGEVKGMKNYDVTDIVKGHLFYRSHFYEIFKRIWGN